MKIDWASYGIGFATPFVVCAILIGISFLAYESQWHWWGKKKLRCHICHKTIRPGVLMYLHVWTKKHRNNFDAELQQHFAKFLNGEADGIYHPYLEYAKKHNLPHWREVEQKLDGRKQVSDE
jgi:hypothetical protein